MNNYYTTTKYNVYIQNVLLYFYLALLVVLVFMYYIYFPPDKY